MDDRIDRGMKAQLERWRAQLAAGAGRAGWKLGMHLRALQEPLGIDTPVLGFLTVANTIAPGSTHALAGGTMVGVEPEIAVHLRADVARDASAEQARGAIAGLGPALEIVDVNGPRDDLEWMLAHNLFQRGVVFGLCDPTRADGSIGDVTVRAFHNGTTVGRTDAHTVLGDVADIIRFAANFLSMFGEQLRAGDRIITGSLTAPVWVQAGDLVTADFGALGTVGLRFEP